MMTADIYNFLTTIQNHIDHMQCDLNVQLNTLEKEIKTDVELLSEAHSDIRQLSMWLEDRLSALDQALHK